MADITLEGGATGLLNNAASGTSTASGLSAFTPASQLDGSGPGWAFSSGSLADVPNAFARALAEALADLGSGIDAVTWPEQAAASTLSTMQSRDPGAATSLAPGAYALAGAPDGTEIRINSGDTWGEVLARLSRTFGAGGAALLGQLVPVTHGLGAASATGAGALEQLAGSLSGVLAAHNEVASLLERNPSAVRPGALAEWGAAGAKRAGALAEAGVERTGNRLWLFGEAFLSALAEDPARVRETLLGADGLLPALKDKAQAALTAGGWLAGAATAGAEDDPVQRVFAVRAAQADALLDLYDAQGGATPEGTDPVAASPLLRRRG